MMISLSRHIEPATFPTAFTGKERIELELELLLQAKEIRQAIREKFTFKSGKWKTAKPNLLIESFGKCAYCEVNFTTVAYGDVEHYRPKSKYWWLAYSYFNYAASCQLCNQRYKGTDFPTGNSTLRAPLIRRNSRNSSLIAKAGSITVDPLDDMAGLPLELFLMNHNRERPLSIDPYVDDPTAYFSYQYNDQTREVSLVPLSDIVRDIAISCIDLFGLNRKELLDLRYRGLLNYRICRQVIEESDSQSILGRAARNLINNEFIHPKAEFAGMYRYFENQPIEPVPDNTT